MDHCSQEIFWLFGGSNDEAAIKTELKVSQVFYLFLYKKEYSMITCFFKHSLNEWMFSCIDI